MKRKDNSIGWIHVAERHKVAPCPLNPCAGFGREQAFLPKVGFAGELKSRVTDTVVARFVANHLDYPWTLHFFVKLPGPDIGAKNRWQEQGGQDRDDRHHAEQLD